MKCMMIMAAVILTFSNVLNAHTQRELSFMDKLNELESNSGCRVGIFAINTANEHVIEYRANEIFPTGCTSKVIGVSAVLKKSMLDPSLLLTNIRYSTKQQFFCKFFRFF